MNTENVKTDFFADEMIADNFEEQDMFPLGEDMFPIDDMFPLEDYFFGGN